MRVVLLKTIVQFEESLAQQKQLMKCSMSVNIFSLAHSKGCSLPGSTVTARCVCLLSQRIAIVKARNVDVRRATCCEDLRSIFAAPIFAST